MKNMLYLLKSTLIGLAACGLFISCNSGTELKLHKTSEVFCKKLPLPPESANVSGTASYQKGKDGVAVTVNIDVSNFAPNKTCIVHILNYNAPNGRRWEQHDCIGGPYHLLGTFQTYPDGRGNFSAKIYDKFLVPGLHDFSIWINDHNNFTVLISDSFNVIKYKE